MELEIYMLKKSLGYRIIALIFAIICDCTVVRGYIELMRSNTKEAPAINFIIYPIIFYVLGFIMFYATSVMFLYLIENRGVLGGIIMFFIYILLLFGLGCVLYYGVHLSEKTIVFSLLGICTLTFVYDVYRTVRLFKLLKKQKELLKSEEE